MVKSNSLYPCRNSTKKSTSKRKVVKIFAQLYKDKDLAPAANNILDEMDAQTAINILAKIVINNRMQVTKYIKPNRYKINVNRYNVHVST